MIIDIGKDGGEITGKSTPSELESLEKIVV